MNVVPLVLIAVKIFVGVAISNPEVVSFISAATRNVKTALFWDSDPQLSQQSRVDGFAPATAGPLAQLLAQRVGFSGEARAARVFKTLDSLWGRHTSGGCCCSHGWHAVSSCNSFTHMAIAVNDVMSCHSAT